MVTSMIPSVDNIFVNKSIVDMRFLSAYNPYINYTWEMLPNAKVKNSGTSGVDLQLYSGNPLDFQGSQYIPVNILNENISNITFGISANTRSPIFGRADQWQSYIVFSSSSVSLRLNTAMTFQYVLPLGEYVVLSFNIDKINNTCTLFENGIEVKTVSITGTISGEILQLLSNMGSYYDGTINFITFHNGTLTPTQIQQSYTNPNEFYNSCANVGGELYANTIFCTDFRGTGGYMADDRNVSVGGELVVNGTFDTDLAGWSVINNWFCENGTAKNTETTKEVLIQYATLPAGTYTVSVTIASLGDGTDYMSIGDGISGKFSFPNATGTHATIIKTTGNATYFYIHGGNGLSVDNISVKPISAVYPITNYSPTMRTNFQTEPTGLQDLTRNFDDLGFYTGVTDYLNCNGKGYGDTGWIPSGTYSIELIYNHIQEPLYKTLFGRFDNTNTFEVSLRESRLRIRGGTTSLLTLSDGYKHLVIPNSDTMSAYIDGVKVIDSVARIPDLVSQVALGCFIDRATYTLFSDRSIRLFKVHNKALTQEEITKNYNDYVAQGLLI